MMDAVDGPDNRFRLCLPGIDGDDVRLFLSSFLLGFIFFLIWLA